MSPLTTENDPQYETQGSAASRKGLSGTPEWLLRVTIESLLIVSSILLALALDEWREGRHNRKVANQSLEVFYREMQQNLAKIDDLLPYHMGMRDVISGMAGDPTRAEEVQTILQGLQPPVLLNTAWQAALATGALTHIDVGTVSVLSFAYDQQQRFRDLTQRAVPHVVITASTTDSEKLTNIQETLLYMNQLVRTEQELQAVYKESVKYVTPSLERADSLAADSVTNGT